MGENKLRYWECKIGTDHGNMDDVSVIGPLDLYGLFQECTGTPPDFIFHGWKDMDTLPEKYQSAIDKREPDLSKITSRLSIAEVVALNTEILRLEANSVFLRNCMNCGLGTKPNINDKSISVGCTLIESAATKCRERNLCRWEESDGGVGR